MTREKCKLCVNWHNFMLSAMAIIIFFIIFALMNIGKNNSFLLQEMDKSRSSISDLVCDANIYAAAGTLISLDDSILSLTFGFELGNFTSIESPKTINVDLGDKFSEYRIVLDKSFDSDSAEIQLSKTDQITEKEDCEKATFETKLVQNKREASSIRKAPERLLRHVQNTRGDDVPDDHHQGMRQLQFPLTKSVFRITLLNIFDSLLLSCLSDMTALSSASIRISCLLTIKSYLL